MQPKKRSDVFKAAMGIFMLLIAAAILVTVALYSAAQQNAASASSMTFTTPLGPPPVIHLVGPIAVYMSAEELRSRLPPTLPPGVTPANANGVGIAPGSYQLTMVYRATLTSAAQNPTNSK